MRPAVECGTCLTHWIYGRASATLAESERLRLLEAVVEAMAESLGKMENLGAVSNRSTDAAFAHAPAARDGYGTAKAKSNRAAATLLPAAAAYVEGAATPRERLLRACFAAAVANVAPLGVPSGPMAFEELRSLVGKREPCPVVIGDPGVAEGAERVVYVADNAGEVGVDSVLLGLLKSRGAHVTLVVKEPAFFEDATRGDAETFGLDRLVDRVVAVDGFLVPAEAPTHAADALARADLVVAKGTGSFEALHGELGDRGGLFLLKVKCGAISRLLRVPVGRFAVVFTGSPKGDPFQAASV